MKLRNVITGFFAATVLLLGIAAPVQAWDGTVGGVIKGIDVAPSSGYDFRIYIGTSAHCTGGPAWAYINSTDPLYSSLVAILTTARSLAAPVVIYTTTTGGYCKIGYVAWNN